jgi:CDP-paratose 2-epimerase
VEKWQLGGVYECIRFDQRRDRDGAGGRIMSALPRPRRRRRPVALAAPDNLATSAPIPFPSRRAAVGMAERFRPGEYERVERALEDLEALDVQHLRVSIPWGEGEDWYRWLLARLAREVEVLPCVHAPGAGAAPEGYAEFVERMLSRAGRHFEYVELGAGGLDQSEAGGEMIGRAARGARARGWKVVLGGLARGDADWLEVLFDHEVMEHIDAVGLHRGGEKAVAEVQRFLDERGCQAQIWVTETGVSTWRSSELRQCQALVEALRAPVPRVYWYALHDLEPAAAARDEGERHFGMKRCDGRPKLLFRLWSSGGLRRVREAARQPAPPGRPGQLVPFPKAPRRPRRVPRPGTPARV